MNGHEVELDQHTHATRQLSALLSAALAAAQAAAQVSAQRARATAQRADQQGRQAEQATLAAQRQAERQQRATESVQHRQWNLRPTAQWLHDKPLSAAAAWASADVHREQDPIAARHAQRWEELFKQEGVDVNDVRADAPAAVATAENEQTPAPSTSGAEPAQLAGELATVEVATGAAAAGAVDAVDAAHAEAVTQWSAYADGAPAAAVGGQGVSKPPRQVLADARQTPDVAATAPQGATRAVELVHLSGLDR